MSTCLLKTLLLYAPLLLLTISNVTWSREHPHPHRSSHRPGSSQSDDSSGEYPDVSLTSTAGSPPAAADFDDDYSRSSSPSPQKAHHKTRRNHKMLHSYGGGGGGGGHHHHHHQHRNMHNDRDYDPENDLALWINEEQVNLLSGMSIKVYAITNGHVSYYVKDPRINANFPTIPSEVNSVNFTWRSGSVRKYRYHFDRLQSLDENILKAPTISIKLEGMVPLVSREFSVSLPCVANASGTAQFSIGLLITRRGKPVPGTPIRLSLKKECAPRAPDPECDKTCANHGRCNKDKICQCPQGFMGPTCQTGLCFPQCMNGGNCTAPGKCSCPPGYHGKHCEGGICVPGCQNGGKCIQKDKCRCSKGYYGKRCEDSKCPIRCLNGGKCIGNNLCRCPAGVSGDHCQVGTPKQSACKKPCGHGVCGVAGQCQCEAGWYGKFCNQGESAV